MSDAEALVTIGITAYNAAETLPGAIGAAQAQTWQNIEIVIVDDHSSDATEEVAQKLSRDDGRIRVFRHATNRGVAAARNTILKHATGALVAFFDDDDESAENRVKRQVDRLVAYEQTFAHGAPVICHTAREQRLLGETATYVPTMGTREGRPAPHGIDVAERVVIGKQIEDGYGALATCSQLARRETYALVGGFDEAFRRSEDSDLVLTLAKAGAHFVGIADPLVVQYLKPNESKNLETERHYFLKVIEKHNDVAGRHGLQSFCHRWIEMKYDMMMGAKLVGLARLLGLIATNPILTVGRLRSSRRMSSVNAAAAMYLGRSAKRAN